MVAAFRQVVVFDACQEVKSKMFEVAPYLRGMYSNSDSPVLAPFYV
jgi:uncharacterized pyridoxamine 5'-phosphate oxidase family protein